MTTLDEQMKVNALEAMKLTRKYFVVELDFSEKSVEELERLFDQVHYAWPGGSSEDSIQHLTRLWGSYLGEVLRRCCGGQWIQTDRGGIALHGEKTDFYPHHSVRKRLVGGADDSIWQYYQTARDML